MNLQVRTVKLSLAGGIFEWALADGIVEHNVAARLPRVKAPIPVPRPATDDIWLELLAAAGPRERLAAEAGLRRAEIAVVHTDDLIRDLHWVVGDCAREGR